MKIYKLRVIFYFLRFVQKSEKPEKPVEVADH